jgi:hypothetical protein
MNTWAQPEAMTSAGMTTASGIDEKVDKSQKYNVE